LLLQIMAMSTMKDAERLELLKEIGGTKVYEERRRESLKILHETDNRRSRILEVVRHRLKCVIAHHMRLQPVLIIYRLLIHKSAHCAGKCALLLGRGMAAPALSASEALWCLQWCFDPNWTMALQIPPSCLAGGAAAGGMGNRHCCTSLYCTHLFSALSVAPADGLA
jgi:hypothetical protein